MALDEPPTEQARDDAILASNAAAQRPATTRRTVDRATLSLPEKHGSWVLAIGSVVTWILALVATKDVVATAFALAGFALIVAAAFYSRVVRIGKDGVDLADVIDVIERTPVQEGDTPQEVRWRTIESVQQLALAVPLGGANPSAPEESRDRRRASWAIERDRGEMNMTDYLIEWLQRQGYRIVSVSKGGERVRTDLVAQRDAGPTTEADLLHVELRPAVSVLRRSDAATIAEMEQVGSSDGARRGLVFREGTLITPDALALLLERGVTVFTLDTGTGVVREHAPPA
jgi:hypothetical protein